MIMERIDDQLPFVRPALLKEYDRLGRPCEDVSNAYVHRGRFAARELNPLSFKATEQLIDEMFSNPARVITEDDLAHAQEVEIMSECPGGPGLYWGFDPLRPRLLHLGMTTRCVVQRWSEQRSKTTACLSGYFLSEAAPTLEEHLIHALTSAGAMLFKQDTHGASQFTLPPGLEADRLMANYGSKAFWDNLFTNRYHGTQQ